MNSFDLLSRFEKSMNARIVSHRCGYFPDKTATVVVFDFGASLPPEYMDFLLAHGYRRCGYIFYRNQCAGCAECRSIRIDVKYFSPNRSQKRNIKLNSDLAVKFDEPFNSEEKLFVYEKYYMQRHYQFNSCFDEFDAENIQGIMEDQMFTNFGNTTECEVRYGDRLVAFSTADIGKESMSAVYTAYDPDFIKRAPGVFVILSMLDECRLRNMNYLYLGFYIAKHPKMGYKNSFAPFQIFDGQKWMESVT